MTKELTHWKKNIDRKYISGEDLQDCLYGLAPEMAVYLDGFGDGETYDKNINEAVTKTVLRFRTVMEDKVIEKGVILNVTAARVFMAITGKSHVDHWVGTPLTMFAKVDKRNGYVVRFKALKMPAELRPIIVKIRGCKDMKELGETYKTLDPKLQSNIVIKTEANKLKEKLNDKK